LIPLRILECNFEIDRFKTTNLAVDIEELPLMVEKEKMKGTKKEPDLLQETSRV